MGKPTKQRVVWRYSKEFKIRAVKLSNQEGVKVKQVAHGLDIHPFLLSRWRKQYREGKLQGDGKRRVGVTKIKKKVPTSKELTENAKLKKEIKRLKEENDLLKKWQRYLAEIRKNDSDSCKDTEN